MNTIDNLVEQKDRAYWDWSRSVAHAESLPVDQSQRAWDQVEVLFTKYTEALLKLEATRKEHSVQIMAQLEEDQRRTEMDFLMGREV